MQIEHCHIMNPTEFDSMSQELRTAVTRIPLRWGHIQNNRYDNELKKVCNIFNIKSLEDLEHHIVRFDEEHKEYYRRRWYLLKCSECDEYLFYCNDNVEHNPNRYDKKWDICINNEIRFDVKGTVIPKSFRNRYEDVIDDPQDIIAFFYE